MTTILSPELVESSATSGAGNRPTPEEALDRATDRLKVAGVPFLVLVALVAWALTKA